MRLRHALRAAAAGRPARGSRAVRRRGDLGGPPGPLSRAAAAAGDRHAASACSARSARAANAGAPPPRRSNRARDPSLRNLVVTARAALEPPEGTRPYMRERVLARPRHRAARDRSCAAPSALARRVVAARRRDRWSSSGAAVRAACRLRNRSADHPIAKSPDRQIRLISSSTSSRRPTPAGRRRACVNPARARRARRDSRRVVRVRRAAWPRRFA